MASDTDKFALRRLRELAIQIQLAERDLSCLDEFEDVHGDLSCFESPGRAIELAVLAMLEEEE